MLLNLLLEWVNELAQRQIELLAPLENGVRRSDLTICLDFDLNVFHERVSFFVASKPDSWVLKKLVSQTVSQSVVLILDDYRALESLSGVIFVSDPKR